MIELATELATELAERIAEVVLFLMEVKDEPSQLGGEFKLLLLNIEDRFLLLEDSVGLGLPRLEVATSLASMICSSMITPMCAPGDKTPLRIISARSRIGVMSS